MSEARQVFVRQANVCGAQGTRSVFLGAGQGAGARFSADYFVAQQKSQAAGATTPGTLIFG